MNKNQITWLMVAISILGLIDSAYLTYDHYTNQQVACPNVGIIDCANVLNSQYAVLLGVVPVSVMGLVFFAIEIGLLFLYKQQDLLLIYNGAGIAFVLYFLFAEYMVHSICIYCTAVHIMVVALLLLTFWRE